jgi:thiamine-phosphate pyrophosphorylase
MPSSDGTSHGRLRRPVISVVTDRHRYPDGDDDIRIERLIEDVRRAVAAGVDLIQVRERGLPDRSLLGLVRRIVAESVGSGALVLVNGRTDVALTAPAAGVHLPAASPPAMRIRELVPAEFVIGRSVHSVEEAIAAEEAGGCDYLIFGTVFGSAGKPSDHVAAGVDALRRVSASVHLPVLAIGGIDPARAGEVAAAGAAGVAAIGMFSTTPEDQDDVIAARVAAVRGSFDDLSQAV